MCVVIIRTCQKASTPTKELSLPAESITLQKHRMGFGQIIGCSIISKVVITAFPYSIISSLSYILDFVPARINLDRMGYQLHSSVVKYRIIDHTPDFTTIAIHSRPFLRCSCHHTDFTTFLHRSLVTAHSFAKWRRPCQARTWASPQVITQLGLPIIDVQEQGQMDQSWPERLSKLNY